MRVADIHHVSLNVDDLAATEDFYVTVLGLTPLPRPDLGFPGAWLAAGDRQVHLLASGPVPTDVGQHFAFAVADLDAAVAELTSKGIEVSKIKQLATGRQAFLHDPSGNRIELNQPR